MTLQQYFYVLNKKGNFSSLQAFLKPITIIILEIQSLLKYQNESRRDHLKKYQRRLGFHLKGDSGDSREG